MNPFSNVFILADQSWPVDCLTQIWPKKAAVNVWVEGRGWIQGDLNSKKNKKSHGGALGAVDLISLGDEDLETARESVAIVGFQDPDLSYAVVQKLRSQNKNLKILEIGTKSAKGTVKSSLRTVAWKDLLPENFGAELELLEIQESVSRIVHELKDTQSVAILLQDDPDPDGLASALALRKVLGRNAQSAPIVSFGAISRPENLAMARLLEITVEKITEKQLSDFGKVIMVDCQPSFFKGRNIKAHVVIDHHPSAITQEMENPESENHVPVVEIREGLGATSTLMTQFMRSQKIEISSRVATALLYGIKSDTLALNRQVSEADLDAFLYLYPRANGNMLRKIERPELPGGYLEALRKALKGFKVRKNIAVLALGSVDKEEWIPQAADFALQAEDSEWSVGCGVYDSKVVLSLRNCGYTFHGGDIFKELWNELGCAGGHRSMAKALIPVESWTEKFGPKSLSQSKISQIVFRKLAKAIQSRSDSSQNVGHA